ncbi:hypothetical protein LK10_11240 [Sinomonas humi]|uniref:Uncharacterized protein n=1 Tax=Sinomonas humi TaxID=1338436 RepID=A0A0B2AI76_9MICC|nr:hypothetical protein LK10_11240 [Sinomonas humi]
MTPDGTLDATGWGLFVVLCRWSSDVPLFAAIARRTDRTPCTGNRSPDRMLTVVDDLGRKLTDAERGR